MASPRRLRSLLRLVIAALAPTPNCGIIHGQWFIFNERQHESFRWFLPRWNSVRLKSTASYDHRVTKTFRLSNRFAFARHLPLVRFHWNDKYISYSLEWSRLDDLAATVAATVTYRFSVTRVLVSFLQRFNADSSRSGSSLRNFSARTTISISELNKPFIPS